MTRNYHSTKECLLSITSFENISFHTLFYIKLTPVGNRSLCVLGIDFESVYRTQ